MRPTERDGLVVLPPGAVPPITQPPADQPSRHRSRRPRHTGPALHPSLPSPDRCILRGSSPLPPRVCGGACLRTPGDARRHRSLSGHPRVSPAGGGGSSGSRIRPPPLPIAQAAPGKGSDASSRRHVPGVRSPAGGRSTAAWTACPAPSRIMSEPSSRTAMHPSGARPGMIPVARSGTRAGARAGWPALPTRRRIRPPPNPV